MNIRRFTQHYQLYRRRYAVATLLMGLVIFFTIWLPHVLQWREQQSWPIIDAVYSPSDKDYTYRIGTLVYKNKTPWTIQSAYVMWKKRYDLLHSVYINPKNAQDIIVTRETSVLWTPSLLIAVLCILYGGHIFLTPAIRYVTEDSAIDIDVDTQAHKAWIEKHGSSEKEHS